MQQNRLEPADSGGLGLAATVLLATAAAAFGFFAAGRIPVPGSGAPATALPVSVSGVLVAFVLMIHRRDVISRAIGLFSLENGISLAALVMAASRMRMDCLERKPRPALMWFLQEEVSALLTSGGRARQLSGSRRHRR